MEQLESCRKQENWSLYLRSSAWVALFNNLTPAEKNKKSSLLSVNWIEKKNIFSKDKYRKEWWNNDTSLTLPVSVRFLVLVQSRLVFKRFRAMLTVEWLRWKTRQKNLMKSVIFIELQFGQNIFWDLLYTKYLCAIKKLNVGLLYFNKVASQWATF